MGRSRKTSLLSIHIVHAVVLGRKEMESAVQQGKFQCPLGLWTLSLLCK